MSLALAVACSLTNGFHDAANVIATLVATRGARPGPAVALSAVFNMLGVIGAGALAATVWNVATWRRGLPSSSGHALVGASSGRRWRRPASTA